MFFLSIALILCGSLTIIHCDTILPTVSRTNKSKRLAYVIPFIDGDSNLVLNTINKWSKYDPCPILSETMNENNHTDVIMPTDLIFYYNKEWESSNIKLEFENNISIALKDNRSRKCFNEIKYISANLNSEADKYPAGPSYMWFKLFLEKIDNFYGIYDYMFWAEHDVFPVRAGWIDKLIEEISFNGNFYVKGSVHRGDALDITVRKYPKASTWIAHINGNSLYKLNDNNFNMLIRETKDLFPPSHGMKNSYDIALWKNGVTNYMINWKSYQTYAHLFVYSDIIQSYCKSFTESETMILASENPNTYFLHGSQHSAGIKAAQRMRNRHKEKNMNLLTKET